MKQILDNVLLYAEAKEEYQIKNSNLSISDIGRDSNGNHIIKVKFPNDPAFSIQASGNLPKAHSALSGKSVKDVSRLSDRDKETIEKEILNYVSKYGSSNQKSKLKIYKESTELSESKEIKSVQNNIGNDIMKYGMDDYFYSLYKTVSSLFESMSTEGKQKQGNDFGKILDHLGSAGTAATKISMDRKYWNKGN